MNAKNKDSEKSQGIDTLVEYWKQINQKRWLE